MKNPLNETCKHIYRISTSDQYLQNTMKIMHVSYY